MSSITRERFIAAAQTEDPDRVGQIGGRVQALAVEGNYAYVGAGWRLVVLDVSSPGNPTPVGQTDVDGHPEGIAVSGNHAYVVDGWDTLTVVDISNPVKPSRVGTCDLPGSASAHDVAVVADHAYVAYGSGGLRVIDISNPAAPKQIGSSGSDTLEAISVAASGDYAYVAAWEDGLRVIDVSTPTAPDDVGGVDTTGDASDVFYTEEGYAFLAAGTEGLLAIDVSSPTAPEKVDTFNLGSADIEHVFVSGGYAFASDFDVWSDQFMLEVLDISDPSDIALWQVEEVPSPIVDVHAESGHAFVALDRDGLEIFHSPAGGNTVQVGAYDLPTRSRDIAIAADLAYLTDEEDGLWVIELSVRSEPTAVAVLGTPGNAQAVDAANGYAYVADGDAGLRVIDVSDPNAPAETGDCDTPGDAKDVFASDSYAYVADSGSGLRVIDISDSRAPVEKGHLDTSGDAVGVHVVAAYAYVADGDDGLRVIDISNPSAPSEVGHYDPRGTIHDVFISESYAYLANENRGLAVVDVSDPTAPTEVGDTDVPYPVAVFVAGNRAFVASETHGLYVIDVSNPASPTLTGRGYVDAGYSVAVAHDHAYVAANDEGLAIWDLPPVPWTAPIAALYPSSHSTDSTVMEGGTLRRYFRLLETDGKTPVSNATVTFSDGTDATSDRNGTLAYVTDADSLGGIGTHTISVQNVQSDDQTYATGGSPSFDVRVSERRYAHSWSYGAVRKASAGLSTGLIAYVEAENNGGMGLTLNETDPDITSDDHVGMKQTFSTEAGGGAGAGLRQNISANASLSAEATTEASLRPFGFLQAGFDQPYTASDRKAQGVFLLLSVLDSATGYPSQPLVVGMLHAGEAELSYLDYVDAQSAGMAAKWTPAHANVGADLDLAAKLGEESLLKDVDLSFTLVDAGVTYLVTAIVTDYGDEYGVSFVDELSLDLTALSQDVSSIKNRLIALLGNQAGRVRKEYIYDSNTDQLKRIEVTLSSEGNPSAFTDVTKKQVAVTFTLTGAAPTRSSAEALGLSATLSDVQNMLGAFSEVPYVVSVQDGSSTSFVPELPVPGTEISVGAGMEVESLRELVRERGVFLDGTPYVTESYSADDYVKQPGKGWMDLTSNALGGLWLLVEDAFNWVGKQVTAGTAWALEVYAETRGGIRKGWARLSTSSGTQILSAPSISGKAIRATGPFTVTASSWVPESAAGASDLTLKTGMATASGDGFVVGGIYDFQPYTLTVSPMATLMITYTEETAAGVDDQSNIDVFRWDPDESNWQPLDASQNATERSLTVKTDRLGTFALGYDDTPPRLEIVSPPDGCHTNTTLPLIRASVSDAGAGIDPSTVEVQLDDETVATTYYQNKGEVLYVPGTPLTTGAHTVTVSAEDVMGHVGTTSATFTAGYRIQLPVVLRDTE